MNYSLKNRYPFRLGTTSFIYPEGYASNVRQLAPLLDEIELLLFESNNLPDRREITELEVLSQEHGITYNVHLPMDVELAAEASHLRQQSITSIEKAIERVAPLDPTTYTLHLTSYQIQESMEMVEAWQVRAIQSMSLLLKSTGLPADCISIETLDYPPLWFQPIVEQLDLSVCVDVGHLILYGFDLENVLEMFAERTTMLHLHGVSSNRDHLSLIHLEPNDRSILSRYLNGYKASASIEVFNLKRLNDSMACFPEIMRLTDPIDMVLES